MPKTTASVAGGVAALALSPRISMLKAKLLSARPGVCTERARVYTEVYKANEDKPVLLKRALALSETLRLMSIRIDDGELVVGNQASRLRSAPIFPEYAVQWILDELDELDKRPGDAFFLSEEDKHALRELCPFWMGRTLIERGYAVMDAGLREIHDAGIISAEGNLTSGDGHIAVNFAEILDQGLGGYLAEVRERRNRLDLCRAEGARSRIFYDSLELGLESLSRFILRFADLARAMSAAESDPGRRRELERICENCVRVASGRPGGFWEALQLVYFVQLALQIESNGHSVSLGRLDQYLHQFFEADLRSGALDEGMALELLECLWIKLCAVTKIRPWSHTRFSAGGPLYQNVTIGGCKPDGEDAVNGLSRLILRSVGMTRLPQPNLSVRYHSGMSDEFMMECVRVIEKGFGMPAFNNDEIVIPGLLGLGVEREDAYDYSAIGCIEIAVPGKWGYRCTGMSFLNFMRVFLAALDDGRDAVTGKTFHKGLGSLCDFTDFGQLMRAWKEQAVFYARTSVAIDTAVDIALEELAPDLLCSAFVDDCIARGRTIKEGGSKYDFVSGLQVGIANLGNALAAIKKLVFEEKRISRADLMDRLRSNFAGLEGEKTRELLLNHAPKYGNDDDYVDELLREAYGYFIEEYRMHRTTRHGRGPIGCAYYAGTSSISANVPQGAGVPATPDGRKAYAPLAEGCSPSSGTDRLGPTAVFKSVGKLPTEDILGGVLLNQKLSPQVISSDQDKRKLCSILRVFFDDLKGWHVQYNIVSRETLLAAQRNPEQYRDLVVRVAGYSAFFTSLSPDTQDDIIARTEHRLY